MFQNRVICYLFMVGASIGCGAQGDDEELGDETGGGEPPESEDNPCCEDPGDSSWWCGCYIPDPAWHWQTFGEPQLCVSEVDAATYCANYCTEEVEGALDWHLTDILCVYPWEPPSPNCLGWDPAGDVTYNTGNSTYYVDFAFISGLVSDPEPVMYCDDALVLRIDSGVGFTIANADSGELLYELGLRDDDVIVSINSMPLNDYDDVVDAVNALWHGGETDYVLEIKRNSVNTYLNYNVYSTL
jgi:hypothetical protein